MWRRVVGIGLLGASTYVVADAASDLLQYYRCASLVQQYATKHGRFLETIQASPDDLRLGPWYDSSVKFSHGGMLATVILPARGGTKSSDITLRVR